MSVDYMILHSEKDLVPSKKTGLIQLNPAITERDIFCIDKMADQNARRSWNAVNCNNFFVFKCSCYKIDSLSTAVKFSFTF